MIRIALVAAAFAAVALPALAQQDFSSVEITVEQAAPGIFMLTGAGGNIGLSTGGDGAFVIDDQFAPLSEKIRKAIQQKARGDIAFLLNTHHHYDHTGGNEAFAGWGATIVAQDNVRKRLKEGSSVGGQETTPAPTAALPVITFSDEVSFYWNGHDIHVFHPPHAHTDGDAVVHFTGANVVHMGDIFFNGNYPFIDLSGGGDLNGYIAAQESVLAMVDDDTKIIPGHGPMATKAELQRTNDLLKDVRARVQALIDAGKDEAAVVAADPLADLNEQWGQGFINGEQMVRTAYQSLTSK